MHHVTYQDDQENWTAGYKYTELDEYVFGAGSYAGIVCISGDCGFDVDYNMPFDEFVGNIEASLKDEYREEMKRELLKQFKSKRLRKALYRKFQEIGAERDAQEDQDD